MYEYIQLTEDEARAHPLYGFGGWLLAFVILSIGGSFLGIISANAVEGGKISDIPSELIIPFVIYALVLAGSFFSKNQNIFFIYIFSNFLLIGYFTYVWDKHTVGLWPADLIAEIARAAILTCVWGAYLFFSRMRLNYNQVTYTIDF